MNLGRVVQPCPTVVGSINSKHALALGPWGQLQTLWVRLVLLLLCLLFVADL